MKLSFFGQFLVEQKLLTEEQLADALALMARTNKRLGALAVEAGWLTLPQAELIKERQRTVDALYGEISITSRLLTGEQVEELLRRQVKTNLRIGDAVRQLGFMDERGVEEAFSCFVEAHRSHSLDTDTFEQPLVSYAIENFNRVLTRMCTVPTKAGGVKRWTRDREMPVACSLPLQGDPSMVVATSMTQEMAVELVAGMLGFSEAESELLDGDLIDDVIGELLNILAVQLTEHAAEWKLALEPGQPRPGGLPDRALFASLLTPSGTGAIIVLYGA